MSRHFSSCRPRAPGYLIGELIDINGDGKPLRYMDQPSKGGVCADCWFPTVGTLDPHYCAGHWFYLASEVRVPRSSTGCRTKARPAATRP